MDKKTARHKGGQGLSASTTQEIPRWSPMACFLDYSSSLFHWGPQQLPQQPWTPWRFHKGNPVVFVTQTPTDSSAGDTRSFWHWGNWHSSPSWTHQRGKHFCILPKRQRLLYCSGIRTANSSTPHISDCIAMTAAYILTSDTNSTTTPYTSVIQTSALSPLFMCLPSKSQFHSLIYEHLYLRHGNHHCYRLAGDLNHRGTVYPHVSTLLGFMTGLHASVCQAPKLLPLCGAIATEPWDTIPPWASMLEYPTVVAPCVLIH